MRLVRGHSPIAERQSKRTEDILECDVAVPCPATLTVPRTFPLIEKMNTLPYQLFSAALLIGVAIAVVVMIGSLMAIIVPRKSSRRRAHVVRLLIALVMAPCLFGVQQAFLWFVFLPALGRQQMADWEVARAKKLVESSVVSVGEVAPEFSLATVDDETFTLPDRGKVVVITFFATWCGPCRKELPHIEQIWAAHKDNRNFRLLVVGREETRETVLRFCEEHNFTFPTAADPSRDVYSLFATEYIPRTVVVAADGRILYNKLGGSPDDLSQLKSLVESQLREFSRPL
jgi:peroxiredoxin